MMELLGLWQRTIEEAIRAQESSLAGGVANWDDYNRRVGKIAGLKQARTLLDDAVEQLRRADDEAFS